MRVLRARCSSFSSHGSCKEKPGHGARRRAHDAQTNEHACCRGLARAALAAGTWDRLLAGVVRLDSPVLGAATLAVRPSQAKATRRSRRARARLLGAPPQAWRGAGLAIAAQDADTGRAVHHPPSETHGRCCRARRRRPILRVQRARARRPSSTWPARPRQRPLHVKAACRPSKHTRERARHACAVLTHTPADPTGEDPEHSIAHHHPAPRAPPRAPELPSAVRLECVQPYFPWAKRGMDPKRPVFSRLERALVDRTSKKTVLLHVGVGHGTGPTEAGHPRGVARSRDMKRSGRSSAPAGALSMQSQFQPRVWEQLIQRELHQRLRPTR